MTERRPREGSDAGSRPRITRRGLLHLGLASAATTLLPPTRRSSAQIGGAQPQAPAAPASELTNPAEFKAPRVKASAPTTLTFWQYVGFHVTAQKFIAEEYKKRFDPNLSLEITAYPGLNEQRVGVKTAWPLRARPLTSSRSSRARTPSTSTRMAA